MYRYYTFLISSIIYLTVLCTFYSCSNKLYYSKNTPSPAIFAHNDYEKPWPFYNAYNLRADFIEADIFLVNNQLMVAHEEKQISNDRTLSSLYLQVIDSVLIANNDRVYPGSKQSLALSIDIKSEAVSTLNSLIEQLKKFPRLIRSKTFKIMISGNMPAQNTWQKYPDYIYFDGRPEKTYSNYELSRLLMISTSFTKYSQWNGNGLMKPEEKMKIQELINASHRIRKPIRFWATTDTEAVWEMLLKMNADIINTDEVSSVSGYIHR